MAFTSLQPDSTTAWLHLILTASPGIYLVSSTGDELLQGSYQSWRAKALALVLVLSPAALQQAARPLQQTATRH